MSGARGDRGPGGVPLYRGCSVPSPTGRSGPHCISEAPVLREGGNGVLPLLVTGLPLRPAAPWL